MGDSGFSAILNQFFKLFLTPTGVIGLVGLLALLLILLVTRNVKWMVLAAMLYMASFGFFLTDTEVLIALAVPLDQLRAFGRPLCSALLVALLVPALMSTRGWRIHAVSGAAAAYFIFEILMSLRTAAAGIADRGIASVLIFVIMFLVMGWGLARWLQEWEDAHRAVRAIAFAGLLFLLGVCYQLLMNSSTIVHGRRLYGTTGNPQHAAAFIAVALPALFYVVAQGGESKIRRICFAATAGFLCILLLWTGSRTGLLMGATAVVLFFRARLRRFAVVSVFIGLFVFLALQIYAESTMAISTMFVRGDTRSHVWNSLWERFLAHPVFGDLERGYGVAENSYLSTAANMGMLGLIPLFVFIIATGVSMVKLLRVRKYLGEEATLADLVIASLVSIAVGAIFEGYLLGTLVFPVFCVYIHLALARFLCDAVTASQPAPPNEFDAIDADESMQVPPVPLGF